MREANPRGIDINLRSGPQMREYAAIADRIAAERIGPVLDWGCGWGQVTSLLHARGVAVEAFDYRDGASVQRVALEKFPQITATFSGEPVALPFATGRFAAVLSCGVLEHVQDPGGSLDELRRVLAPGGRLFVYKLPNRFSYLEAIARMLGLYYHGKLPHDRVYDRRRTVALLGSHGFRVEHVRRANMLPLTAGGSLAARHAERIWALNERLARLPLLELLATNIEADATAV